MENVTLEAPVWSFEGGPFATSSTGGRVDVGTRSLELAPGHWNWVPIFDFIFQHFSKHFPKQSLQCNSIIMIKTPINMFFFHVCVDLLQSRSFPVINI